jgi:methylenetetrahydrofolate reductase (NADPH)
MHHLTLVSQTKDELAATIRRIKDAGIRNILALRGDPPVEMGKEFRKVEGGLEYSYELVDLIREVGGDWFSIGVAGFPEGHVNCPSKDLDSIYLARKVRHGADFVVTQLFFDNSIYSEYVERVRRAGVNVAIVPGVLPITDYAKLLQFCDTCGAYICDEVHKVFGPVKEDAAATIEKGVDFAARQCEDLLARGAPGIHFYCLNKAEPVKTIWEHLKSPAPAR